MHADQARPETITPDIFVRNLLVRGPFAYPGTMPRCVTYRIVDREDGLFDVIATVAPDKIYRRDGFSSLAEIEDWTDDLRILMAAIGAPLAQAQPGSIVPVEEPAETASARTRLRRFRDAVAAAGPGDDATASDALSRSDNGAERI